MKKFIDKCDRGGMRTAFSMVELVLVIVVLGILAAVGLPRLERDLRQEAADNILSAIRYTQHLALIDDKTNPFDSSWQKLLWHIRFSTGGDNLDYFYVIASNTDKNSQISQAETAIDPANGKYFYNQNGNHTVDSGESSNILIGKKYGIDSITFGGGCNGHQHIAFDHLGRPHVGIYSASNDYSTYMKEDCNLTFSSSDNAFDPFSIIITKETGYAYIDGQPDS
jgi:prepilin-type N-terminal cleavage/methylation domain-containing protein